MTPGTYLRLRREAYEAALGAPIVNLGVDPERLRAIEADETDPTLREFLDLRVGFDFDIDVFHEILLGDPHQVCRMCACSYEDPCDPPCSWAEDNGPAAEGLCDAPACLEKAKAAASC